MSSKVTEKFILCDVLLTLAVCGISALIFLFVSPGTYFRLFPYIPTFFFLFEILLYLCTRHAERFRPETAPFWFFGIKIAKLTLTLFVTVFYCIDHREIAVNVLLSVGLIYVAYLVLETVFYYGYESSKVK
jgi:ABC-type xylose transport system permease subunit